MRNPVQQQLQEVQARRFDQLIMLRCKTHRFGVALAAGFVLMGAGASAWAQDPNRILPVPVPTDQPAAILNKCNS